MKHESSHKTNFTSIPGKGVPLLPTQDAGTGNRVTSEERQAKNKTTCKKCGGGLVCPKCHPVIEQTNAIIVRYKDTAYNGGYPNALVIAPLYVKDSGHEVSVATLVGDNFYEGFTYYANRNVKDTLLFLAECDADDIIQLFQIKSGRKRAVKDMLDCIKGHVAGGNKSDE